MKMLHVLATIALVCLLSVASTTQAELLTNPGFEDTDSNGNYGDGWGSYGSAGFHNFFGANGHASLFMDNPGNWGGVFQTGIAANPGDEYTFSLDNVRIESNAEATVGFGLEYFAVDDATKLGDTLVAIPLSPTGDNLSFSMTGTPVAGTVFVRPIIQFGNVTSTASGQENLFVFSASLTSVPEPSAMVMISLAGIVSVAGLRRRVA